MAYLRKTKTGWRAEVQRRGTRKAKVFRTKAAAEAWAKTTEQELADGRFGIIRRTVAELLQRYEREVSSTKRGYKWERDRIALLCRDPLADVMLPDLSAADIAEWRDRRLQQVSPASVRREWNLLNHAFNVAIQEWEWLAVNPMTRVKRPAPPPPRQRQIADKDIETIIQASGYTEGELTTATARMCAAWLFAIETAMRAGEIAGICPEHDHGTYVHLPQTKGGVPRDVPLTTRAREILDQVGSNFNLTSDQISTLFRKVRDRSGITDLTFHDSRAAGLTRLSRKLDVLELARVSGHKDLKMLLNVYYRPSINDLAKKLG